VVLNAVSVFAGLVDSWPTTVVTAKYAVGRVVAGWWSAGLPRYAQFDSDAIFQGPHQWPDTVGRVTRTCLSLGAGPVFAPRRETGFRAAIESYKGRWQSKVWVRFKHASLAALVGRSDRHAAAARPCAAGRIAVLGRTSAVDAAWGGRLVRADVDLDAREIRSHTLRRRQSDVHRLLATTPYAPPTKRFRERPRTGRPRVSGTWQRTLIQVTLGY